MYEHTFVQENSQDAPNHVHAGLTELRAAVRLVKQDRTKGLAALNLLFRSGTVPEPALNGPYVGELVVLDIAPGLTQFYEWLTSRWLPWLGKTFNAAQGSGDNIFTKDSYPLARLFNPFYRGFNADGPKRYRGFAFHTYVAPGLIDPDRKVLKIDYNLDVNPALTIRRVLDELMQVDHNLFLGKAHVRWWWRHADEWQTVAYFVLRGD